MQWKLALCSLAFLTRSAAKTNCTVPANTTGADDGNVHCWDRHRRCDGPNAHKINGTGYQPPCGVCEGLGGPAWGDNNEDIVIPKCTPISRADKEDPPKRPKWGDQSNGGKFTVHHDRFLMIGPKRDPFCFKFFPFKDSTQPLCYRRQTGTFYYDMASDMKTLRYDLNIHIPWPSDNHSLLGNVTTMIVHRGPDMWIVNDLKAFHQCICTRPIPEGYTKLVYPVMHNWTNLLSYIGREEFVVEYDVGLKQLEHWNYGPHHVWTEVGSDKIVRMWQPYNGFEVFPRWEDGVNETVFQDIVPPEKCKKGKNGAIMRIGCTDDGYPNKPTPYPPMLKETAAPEDPEPPAIEPPSIADLKRAKTRIPRRSHKGSNFRDMSGKLNRFLRAYRNVKECANWTVEELQELQAKMLMLRAPQLDDVYKSAEDRRQLRGDVEAHGKRWENLSRLSKKLGGPYETMHRDGHCHEAVMWFVHHITEDVRNQLVDLNMEVPLLPYEKHECPAVNHDQEHQSLCDEYVHQVSCQDCHADDSGLSKPDSDVELVV